MKVGFVGTGGTGKTTTVLLLEDLGLPYIKSTPRSVFTELGIVEVDQNKMTPEECWKVQQSMFGRKRVLDEQHPHGLFDRTLIDHLAYCYYRAADVISDNDAELMEHLVRKSIALYDLVCYFPILPFNGNDGLRQQGLAYRAAIDALMLGFLHKFQVPYVWVGPGTPEERAEQVRKVITNLKKDTHI